MSLESLSSVTRFYASRGLRDGLLGLVKLFHDDLLEVARPIYGRDAASLLHDLGGLASAW